MGVSPSHSLHHLEELEAPVLFLYRHLDRPHGLEYDVRIERLPNRAPQVALQDLRPHEPRLDPGLVAVRRHDDADSVGVEVRPPSPASHLEQKGRVVVLVSVALCNPLLGALRNSECVSLRERQRQVADGLYSQQPWHLGPWEPTAMLGLLWGKLCFAYAAMLQIKGVGFDSTHSQCPDVHVEVRMHVAAERMQNGESCARLDEDEVGGEIDPHRESAGGAEDEDVSFEKGLLDQSAICLGERGVVERDASLEELCVHREEARSQSRSCACAPHPRPHIEKGEEGGSPVVS